mgnify:CR=1 FL=1
MKWKSNPELPATIAYCLIDNIPVTEMHKIDEQKDLHTKFYENYQKGDFNFCIHALEHLKGKWGGKIDSYYDIMEDRISKYNGFTQLLQEVYLEQHFLHGSKIQEQAYGVMHNLQ